MNILLGTTGSVAATLTPKIVQVLRGTGHDVQVIATERSLFFWDPALVPVKTWRDEDEWGSEKYQRGEEIMHIKLRAWADLFIIAPLSATTLAKIANGIADTLLTSVMRAWDRTKTVVLAPAMNTSMWDHPATEEHMTILKRWYSSLQIVDPIKKVLACGEEGIGAMGNIDSILSVIPTDHARSMTCPDIAERRIHI